MKFPWDRYCSIPVDRRPTMQIYITNKCNLRCDGCFARNAMAGERSGYESIEGDNDVDAYMSMSEYKKAVAEARSKGARQINLLGGEPLLHRQIDEMCSHNFDKGLKTTIYTNGLKFGQYNPSDFHGAKLRVSIDGLSGGSKPFDDIHSPVSAYRGMGGQVDYNYMVGGDTTLNELVRVANECECIGGETFFISSYRYLDNNKDFFNDDAGSFSILGGGNRYTPPRSMPLIRYKELVHAFLHEYTGNMDIHISKRGVFEDLHGQPSCQCNFVNYFIGGKVIQCPYDVVNLKHTDDWEFGKRYCQHNSTCLMSKIVVRPCRRNG